MRRSRLPRCGSRRSSSHLLIKPLARIEVRETVCVRGKAQALLAAETEKPAPHERIAEEAERAILQRAIEIDQHIAARHQMRFEKHAVRRETMIREHDARLERLRELRRAIRRVIIVRER